MLRGLAPALHALKFDAEVRQSPWQLCCPAGPFPSSMESDRQTQREISQRDVWMDFRSASLVAAVGPGHAVCSAWWCWVRWNRALLTLFILFFPPCSWYSTWLQLGMAIYKLEPVFAKFILRPNSSLLTISKRRFSLFSGKGAGFCPTYSFPVQNYIWACRAELVLLRSHWDYSQFPASNCL